MTHKRTSKGPQEGGGTPTHWVAVDPHPAVDDPGAVGHGAQSTEDVAVPLSLQREPGLRWARLRAEDESRGAQPLTPRGTWRGGQAAKGPRGPTRALRGRNLTAPVQSALQNVLLFEL